MDDQFRVADELQELGMNLQKRRLPRQALLSEAVHLERALVDVALRIQIAVKGAAR